MFILRPNPTLKMLNPTVGQGLGLRTSRTGLGLNLTPFDSRLLSAWMFYISAFRLSCWRFRLWRHGFKAGSMDHHLKLHVCLYRWSAVSSLSAIVLRVWVFWNPCKPNTEPSTKTITSYVRSNQQQQVCFNPAQTTFVEILVLVSDRARASRRVWLGFHLVCRLWFLAFSG